VADRDRVRNHTFADNDGRQAQTTAHGLQAAPEDLTWLILLILKVVESLSCGFRGEVGGIGALS
jgi:hypothetical protein